MTDTAKLRELIESKGLKLKFIAEQLGITPYGLQKKINNINEFKVSEVMILCDILNISDLKEREAIFYAKMVH